MLNKVRNMPNRLLALLAFMISAEKFIERKKQEYEELQMELERMREVGHG